jgi:NAD(P)-dependent dehydrogenase (short-subunit alcohol dehydrogenase family)
MTKRTIIVAGYGPNVSHQVALAFGKLGYDVALLSRTKAKLDSAAAEMGKLGIRAKGFPTDLTDPMAVKAAIESIKKEMGSISILFWNPYMYGKSIYDGEGAIKDLQDSMAVCVISLATAVQACQSDLEAAKGAILVTGGGLSLENEMAVNLTIQFKAEVLAVPKAAQRKLVHCMHEGLKDKGIFVGEVTINGMVKGTAFDPNGESNITDELVAQRFVDLFNKRKEWNEILQ